VWLDELRNEFTAKHAKSAKKKPLNPSRAPGPDGGQVCVLRGSKITTPKGETIQKGLCKKLAQAFSITSI
jgi:hypothetical protein